MLEQLLALDVYHMGLVFARMGGAFMVLPGFAVTYVPVRVRLFIAVGVSVVIMPLVAGLLPPRPETAGGLIGLMCYELTIGVFVGMLAQTMMSALHFMGTILAMSSGLSNALAFDPVTETQSALVNSFVTLVALVLIFITGAHMVMIEAVTETFTLFPSGGAIPTGDMANYMARMLAESFSVGLRLASPFIVFSLVFQTALGVISRLMPQMNVFFVGLPIQILLALGVLMVVLPSIMLWFLTFYDNTLHSLFAATG